MAEGPEAMEVVREEVDDHDAGWKLVSQGVSPARPLPVQEVQSDLTRAVVDEEDRSEASSLVEIGPFVVEVKDTPWRAKRTGTALFPAVNGHQSLNGAGNGDTTSDVHDAASEGSEEQAVSHTAKQSSEEMTDHPASNRVGEGSEKVAAGGLESNLPSPHAATLSIEETSAHATESLYPSVMPARGQPDEIQADEEGDIAPAPEIASAKEAEEIQRSEAWSKNLAMFEASPRSRKSKDLIEVARSASSGTAEEIEREEEQAGPERRTGGILKSGSMTFSDRGSQAEAGEGWGIRLDDANHRVEKGISKSQSEGQLDRQGKALWEKARQAFLAKRDDTGVGGNDSRRKVASMWSFALQATLKSGMGKASGVTKGTQTVDRQHLPHLAAVNVVLREICEATQFAYGEVWLRQHRHIVTHKNEPDDAEPSTGLRRSLDFNRLRRRSLDGLSRPVRGQWAGILQRHSSFNPATLRRHQSIGSDRQHAPHTPNITRQGSASTHIEFYYDDEHEQLAKRLRWTGYTFAHTERFEAGEANKYVAAGWRDRLDEFRRQGEGRLQFYEKGKGFPGMAWARKELDWHDLAFLPEDDDLAADQRVMTAKTMFDFSVGVPVLDLDSGRLMAVVMLYHVATQRTHRPMQNYKSLSKSPKTVHMLTEFAYMAFHALNMQETAEELSQVISKHCFTSEMQGSFRYPRQKEEKPEEKDTMWTRTKHFWHKYIQKLRGQPDARIPQGHTWQFSLLAGFGTFVGIFAITSVDNSLRSHEFEAGGREPENPTNRPFYPVLLINSFAAVAAMLFAAATSPLVQPRSLFGGHVIASVVAVAIDHLSNPEFGSLIPQWVATPLAPATAIGLMTLTGLTHPPACACAVIFMMGEPEIKNMGWYFILMPVLTDCVLLIIIAVIINNLSKDRHYPLYW